MKCHATASRAITTGGTNFKFKEWVKKKTGVAIDWLLP
jgi:hypothetical protein